MNKTNSFQGENGNISSLRTGNSSFKLTNYLSNSSGGTTFYSKNMVTRINNKGQTIATGLRSGRNVSYIGENGGVSSRIKPFV